MQKILQTCFLAFLCLVGSATIAKVADSPPPGVDTLHRFGDPHRGGETRPDTFPPGSSLVDMSGPAGQRSESSSADGGMLYIEIDSPNPPDTLWVTFWEHLLEDSKAVTPGVSYPLVGENGNFFQGSMHQKVYTAVLPKTMPKGFFSLKAGDSELLNHWFFSSKDRVRMRFDLTSGSVLFGGPQGEFYRTQYLLDRIIAEGRFNSDPVLIAGSREGIFADTVTRSKYQRALENPADLYTRIKVVVPADDGWDHLNSYLTESPADRPGWELLEEKRSSLTEFEYQRLTARLKGEILTGGVKKAVHVADLLKVDQDKGQVFMDWAENLGLKNETESHPLLVQGVTSLQRLESRITGTRFFESLGGYSPALRDEMIAYYILKNFNRFGDRLPQTLEEGLARVHTPWIKERLVSLRDIQEAGFVSEGLFDQEGNPVDLSEYRGKTVLVHFWISGCKFCRDEYLTVMKSLEEAVQNNPDILLVTVNADPETETWKSSLASEMYTSRDFLNLHASRENSVLTRYSIQTFPQKIVLGPDAGIKLQAIDRMDADSLIHLLNSIQIQAPSTFSPSQTLPL
jgi:thiol-disulfide isomerase/thioredoxin